MVIPTEKRESDRRFRHLELVARLAMVVGWLAILGGLVMLALSTIGGPQGAWMTALILVGAGAAGVLNGGVADVLIAIEGHLREARAERSVPDQNSN